MDSLVKERVLLAVHELVKEFIERGDVDVLLRGVSIDAIASRCRSSLRDVNRACKLLEEEGHLVVYRDSAGRVDRVKPVQLEAIRFLLENVPT
mgnify:CR=1 FL=1